jgi:hypothetical protein
MAISPSNENIIYASFSAGPTWNNNNQNMFFKSNNGGITWSDLTASLPSQIFEYLCIDKIIVNPYNPDTVWIAIGGIYGTGNYGGTSRVFKSVDGGFTWNEYSNNLPPFPVNTIIYQKGSNGGLYAATDVGVFL